MNATFQAAIFDLDGTLLNSLGDIAHNLNAVFIRHGYAPVESSIIQTLVGDGAYNLVRKASVHNCIDLTEMQICRLRDEYTKMYMQADQSRSHAYNGILNLLDLLNNKNIPIAVMSNKPQAVLEVAVQRFFSGIDFVLVWGHSKLRPLKPDPAGAIAFAQACGIPFEHIVFVGDSHIDMQTAHNAGMRSVGVTWGFESQAQLVEAGAKMLVEHPWELSCLFQ